MSIVYEAHFTRHENILTRRDTLYPVGFDSRLLDHGTDMYVVCVVLVHTTTDKLMSVLQMTSLSWPRLQLS